MLNGLCGRCWRCISLGLDRRVCDGCGRLYYLNPRRRPPWLRRITTTSLVRGYGQYCGLAKSGTLDMVPVRPDGKLRLLWLKTRSRWADSTALARDIEELGNLFAIR